MQGNVVAASILLAIGLVLVAAGLIVIAADRTDRPHLVGSALVLAGFLCAFAALLTAPD